MFASAILLPPTFEGGGDGEGGGGEGEGGGGEGGGEAEGGGGEGEGGGGEGEGGGGEGEGGGGEGEGGGGEGEGGGGEGGGGEGGGAKAWMKITNEYTHVGFSLTIAVVGAEGYLRATRRRLEARPPPLLQSPFPPVYD